MKPTIKNTTNAARRVRAVLGEFYRPDSINSIMSGRMRPSLQKAITIEKAAGIPMSAWENITAYTIEQEMKGD